MGREEPAVRSLASNCAESAAEGDVARPEGKQVSLLPCRSGFGKQCTSNKPSSPGFGFGSSSRDAFRNQYASAEVDKAKVRSQGGDNPLGAAYNVPVGAECPRQRWPAGAGPLALPSHCAAHCSYV